MKTMSQAMARTTQVRMAVPRLDSTPSMPTFPRMDVRAANTADSTAQMSQESLVPFDASTSFFSIISMVPANITAMPIPAQKEKLSPRKMKARIMVRMVELLSMGATLLTSPICTARK